jgi:phosphoribosylformylglycinamidine synthase
VVVGVTDSELGGSEWAAVLHGLRHGRPPGADLDAARAVHDVIVDLVTSGRLVGVHDCADGGLAVALAEMAFGSDVGFSVDLAGVPIAGPALTPAEVCFSESTSRVVLAVASSDLARVLAMATDAGVPVAEIGEAGGDRLSAVGAFDVGLDDAHRAWSEGLPAALGLAATAVS